MALETANGLASKASEIGKLYQFIKTRAALESLDPCVSLIYCIVLHMNKNGIAESNQVLNSHNLLSRQKIAKVTESKEYKELSQQGFIYAVRINAGKTSALKFQRLYAEPLKEDRYQQLLSILRTAPAISEVYPTLSQRDGKSRRRKTPLQKLLTRVNREIRRKTYLSDILISEDEYDLLLTELKKTIKSVRKTKHLDGNPLFAVGMVQVALRVYQDGNFWGKLYEELELPKGDGAEQRIIGTAFNRVLKDCGRALADPNKYVQNIMLHCFVADPYLDSYYSFLYAVYSSLLDRDLEQLNKDAMNALIERGDRSNLLMKNTAEAIRANPRGAKIRIRNHMKLLDKLFWDPDYTMRTSNRLYSKLQLWARHSDKMMLDRSSSRTGGVHGKKHFSRPYLFFDQLHFAFRLILPQQIYIGDDPDLRWSITGQIEQDLEPEIVEGVVGYRVQECEVALASWRDLLGDFRIKLIDREGSTVRSFLVPKASTRFFDEDGYLISTNNLHAGTIYTVSDKNTKLISSAHIESRQFEGMVLSAFQFEDEDILLLPSGKAIAIGRETIVSGLAGNTTISNARCILQDGETLCLMSKLPHLVLRTSEKKAPGTCIEINSKRYSLTDVAAMSFPIDDRSGDTGYWIDLERIADSQNGLYEIIADVPGGATRSWRFVLLNRFRVSFDDAPYIFESRGIVRFNEGQDLRSLEEGCEKEPSGNVFRFELSKVGRSIDFALKDGSLECVIQVDVPALFTSFTGEEWSAERPDAIWHSELPDMIYVSYPQNTITLFAEDISDESIDDRSKDYNKKVGESYTACDIRWFKSYLDNGKNISILYIQIGSTITELLRVVRHSIPTSCTVFQIDDGNAICVDAVIIGKGDYYVDIFRDGKLLAEKEPLKNGSCKLNRYVKNGQYFVELFELEEDESGFEETSFYSIGKYSAEIVNPYDLSGRCLQVQSVESKLEKTKSRYLYLNYYIEKLKRAGGNSVYSGTMVVEDTYKKLAAIPVVIKFLDVRNPTLIYITHHYTTGKPAPLLYDTKRNALLTKANQNIPAKAQLQRYISLDTSKYCFKTEFVESRNTDCSGIPDDLALPEYSASNSFTWKASAASKDSTNQRVKPSRKEPLHKDNIGVLEVTWSKNAFPYVLLTQFETIGEFAKWTKNELQEEFGIPDYVIRSIDATISYYGVRFAKQKDNTTKPNDYDEDFDAIEHQDGVAQKEYLSQSRVSAKHVRGASVKGRITGNDPSDSPIETLDLQKMTLNCLKQAGFIRISQLLAVYKKSGSKGFGGISHLNSEMQEELLRQLRHKNLIIGE